MTYLQETLAQALNHLDNDMILAAHAPRKKLRRIIPVVIAAVLVVALWVSYPYLRRVINTDSDLLNAPDETSPGMNNSQVKPVESPIKGTAIPVTLGGTTLTLLDVTETTATLEVVKTDDVPVYAMFYDRLESALASTQADYTHNGVVIRPNTIKVTIEGSDQVLYTIPSAPGTYTVTLDFESIRNGKYPMREYVGLYAYIGKDGAMVTVFFSLDLPEADTTEQDAVTQEPAEE